MARILFLFLALSCTQVIFSQNDFYDLVKLPASTSVNKIIIAGNAEGFNYSKLAASKNAVHIKVFVASKLDFDKFFQNCKDLNQLKEVELIGCGISVLPNSIKYLHRLEILNLRDNQLRTLPDSFIALKSLRKLNLEHNSYLYDSEVYERLREMQVEEINFSNSGLFEIDPKIGTVKTLHSINYSGNNIKVLPATLGHLNLKEVDLSDNLHLDSIKLFVQLSTLKSLEILKLEQCELSILSESIGNLKNLRILDLKGNLLKKLPESISELTELTELNLGMVNIGFRMNLLTSLPVSFSKLTKLQKLDLSGCQISSLPSGFEQLSGMEYLDFSLNHLPDFPLSFTKFKSLRYLNLDQNDMVSIPESIGEMTALEELRLNGNFFNRFNKKIKIIPGSIGKLHKLKVLTLRDNVVEQLPNTIGELTNLELLDLRDNLLATLPESICKLSKIKLLDLKTNELTSLPSCFSNLSVLSELNLAMNPNLKVESYLSAIQKLKQLHYLDISFNNINKELLQPLITELPNCKVVNINKHQPEKEKPNQGDYKFEKPVGR